MGSVGPLLGRGRGFLFVVSLVSGDSTMVRYRIVKGLIEHKAPTPLVVARDLLRRDHPLNAGFVADCIKRGVTPSIRQASGYLRRYPMFRVAK